MPYFGMANIIAANTIISGYPPQKAPPVYISSGSGGSTSGSGGSVTIMSGTSTSTGYGGNISITSGHGVAAPPPVKGGDVTFSPGKGMNGAPGGSVIWRAADDTELLRLNETGISLFGQHIPIEKVLKLLSKLNEKQCSCSTAQLMMAGCKCGGS